MSKRSKKNRHGKGASTSRAPRFELSSVTLAQLDAAAKSRRAAAQGSADNSFTSARAIAERTKKQSAALLHAPATAFKSGAAARIAAQAAAQAQSDGRAMGKTLAKYERQPAARPVLSRDNKSPRLLMSGADLKREQDRIVKDVRAYVARHTVAAPLIAEAPAYPATASALAPFSPHASYSAADNAALRADLWTIMTATLGAARRARCERTAEAGHLCGMPAIGTGNHGLATCETHDRETRLALAFARLQRPPKR